MYLSGIMSDSVVDGPGVRLTLFFQGCPHHCEGCQNPKTWEYTTDCQIVSVDEVLEMLDNDEILGGITLSGGEPFSERNFEEIEQLCKAVKAREKTVWIYTGYTMERLIQKYPQLVDTLLPYIDVVVDGPFVLAEKDLLCHFRGSRNQRLVDVKKYLSGDVDFERE